MLEFAHSIDCICHTNGLLLYMLYREIQEVIGHDVILPRLKSWKISQLCELILQSKEAYSNQYNEILSIYRDDEKFKKDFDSYVRKLSYEYNGNSTDSRISTEDFLTSRCKELIDNLDVLREYFCVGPFKQDQDTLEDVLAIHSDSESIDRRCECMAYICRLFWPMLFFYPEDHNGCWTWPADRQFILKRLLSMSRAHRPNVYLPTVLPIYIQREEFEITIPSALTLTAAHQAGKFGNDQRIEASESPMRLISGVAAFDDRIIANYYDVSRELEPIRYDLLMGSLSGLHIKVKSIEDNQETQGLLVLCSPLIRFFHELSGASKEDAQILITSPPVAWKKDLDEDSLQHQCWNRFGKEVFVHSRLLSRESEDAELHKLINDCKATFENTNGRSVLHTIGNGYQLINEHLSLLSDSQHDKHLNKKQYELNAVNLEEFYPGKSDSARKIRKKIIRYAKRRSPIIIYGAKGTGKQYVATAIQRLRGHKVHQFCCNEFVDADSEAIRNEFCGVAKNRFTDVIGYDGLFYKMKGHTVFLDEIQDLNMNCQRVLKTIIENKTITRRGEPDVSVEVDFDLLIASNRNLQVMVSQGSFLPDLYDRFGRNVIYLPESKDHREDIPEYIDLYVRLLEFKIARSAKRRLLQYDYPWPGNVRELWDVIKNAVSIAEEKQKNIIADLEIIEAFENAIEWSVQTSKHYVGKDDTMSGESPGAIIQEGTSEKSVTFQEPTHRDGVSGSRKKLSDYVWKMNKLKGILYGKFGGENVRDRTQEWYDEVIAFVKELVFEPSDVFTFNDLFNRGDFESYLNDFYGIASAKMIWTSFMDGSCGWKKQKEKLGVNGRGIISIRSNNKESGHKGITFTEVDRIIALVYG